MEQMKISCVILAAGNSERMGQSKPFLRFNDGLTFLERIVTTYRSQAIEDMIVVVNNHVFQQIQKQGSKYMGKSNLVLNQHPEYGRFHSIKIGIMELFNASHVFIHNVDNPLVEAKTILSLKNEINEADYAVPVLDGNFGHPILLSDKVINAILQNQQTDLNLRKFLLAFKRREVKVNDKGILVNINTPEEYSMYFQND